MNSRKKVIKIPEIKTEPRMKMVNQDEKNVYKFKSVENCVRSKGSKIFIYLIQTYLDTIHLQCVVITSFQLKVSFI